MGDRITNHDEIVSKTMVFDEMEKAGRLPIQERGIGGHFGSFDAHGSHRRPRARVSENEDGFVGVERWREAEQRDQGQRAERRVRESEGDGGGHGRRRAASLSSAGRFMLGRIRLLANGPGFESRADPVRPKFGLLARRCCFLTKMF